MTAGATGGQILARTLRRLGVESVFSVSGNQILAFYDAAGDAGLRVIHMRHESATAYAAAAHAELTGLPGVALTSAGPGFVAGLTGVAVARSMELPLLYLSGAAPLTQRGIGAFQDIDQKRIAGSICKATLEVPSVERLASTILRAWTLARSGIPGPVHVALPVDVLLATTTARARRLPRDPANGSAITPADRTILDAIAERLAVARRPLIVARPAATRGRAGEALRSLSDILGVEPLITESPRGLSDQKFSALIRRAPESDVALVIAPADFAVSFLSTDALASDGDVLLIDAPGDPRPSRLPSAWLRMPPLDALSYLAASLGTRERTSLDDDWSPDHPIEAPPAPPPDNDVEGLHPLAVAEAIRSIVRPEDVVVLDGGEFCQWIRLGLRTLPNTMLWNGKFGAIGGGIPMGIGAALACREGRAIVIMGDGSAGYHLSEFETAARYSIPIIGIIGNDARWAAEWHMQRARYGPDRAFDTTLLPARYDAAAQGFGGIGVDVVERHGLEAALSHALSFETPTCLNVHVQSLRSPAEVKH